LIVVCVFRLSGAFTINSSKKIFIFDSLDSTFISGRFIDLLFINAKTAVSFTKSTCLRTKIFKKWEYVFYCRWFVEASDKQLLGKTWFFSVSAALLSTANVS
jgi:hypothetical protein